MSFGDILVAKGLASPEQIVRALDHQKTNGGRIGESLIALGVVTQEQVTSVISEVPPAPLNLEETGVDPVFLLQLMLKGMFLERMEVPSQLAEALKLSVGIINKLLQDAKDRKLVETLGAAIGGGGAIPEMRHALTKAGREWTQEAIENSQYFGPAPVALEAWQDRILRQRVTNETISRTRMEEAFQGLVMPERFLMRLGPAINSGNPMLIYGPAGNGKTTVAEIIGKIFENVVFVPYCVEIGGEIMKIYDPTIHRSVEGSSGVDTTAGVRVGPIDRRWVPCYRPMVITGGELTLEMLDLKFNPIAKYYEAPLHVKALNGTFLIDDFGRQLAKPEQILNRWIVPLNSKVDYLSLHSGKSVKIPFDEIVIFSTNMHPNDLMDPAFQRRISYKLETLEPPEDLYKRVFKTMAAKQGLELPESIYQQVIDGIRLAEAPLAYFQPKFIVEQVLASCKFEGIKPQFTPQNTEDALANLFIQSHSKSKMGVMR
ncbi:MAG: ATPase [Rhodospirillaceae bacterium]|nr:ATPase [Rhodospirillaceae bacterium]